MNRRIMLVSLTVGKVDAGVAVLLTDDKRLVSPKAIFLLPHFTVQCLISSSPKIRVVEAVAE